VTREELVAIVGYRPSDEQWEAISAPVSGPLLVLAGAGSGKTAVMAARVVWLVATGQVEPPGVLGLTFTNKAAGELSARVRSLLSPVPGVDLQESGEPTVCTFHRFAMDLIAQYGLLAGAEPSAALLTPTDLVQRTYRVVARSRVHCEELGTSHIKTVCDRVRALDDELSEHLITPQQVRDHDRRFEQALAAHGGAAARDAAQAARRRQLLSRVVDEVREDRTRDAVVGFADLMRLAVEVTRHETVQTQMRERFTVALVDEYQDTSVAQRVMLQNLFGRGYPLTAVGDPLQAIYGWRGASVANIDGFCADFPAADGPAPVTPLSINRRSGSLILDVANEVAAPVRSQHPGVRVLRPADGTRGEVSAALFGTWAEESAWLVAQIRAQIDGGRRPGEIAVLCRTNTHVRAVADSLREAGVPTAAASLGSVLHRPEVIEVVSALRVLDAADNPSVVRLLTGPRWRIGPGDLAVLGARAASLAGRVGAGSGPADVHDALRLAAAGTDPAEAVSLLDAVYDPGPAVSGQARERLRELAAELDAIRPALALGIDEAAHRVVEVTGLAVEVRLGGDPGNRMDGLAALFDIIAAYRSSHDEPSVPAFLRWLGFAEQLDEVPEVDVPVRGDAVQVMTVHRAKGLQWECVFVPALTDGVFPSSQGRRLWTRDYGILPYPLRGDRSRLPGLPGWTGSGTFGADPRTAFAALKEQYAEYDAWEENRLAYVALTRAKTMMAVSGHWWPESGKRRDPSPYLLAVRDVAGVVVPHWVEDPGDEPPTAGVGDVEWPRADAVYCRVDPPVAPAPEPSAVEAQRLARMDADIEAVVRREYEQSRPVRSVELPPVMSASMLMRAAADPQALARDLARPMPRPVAPAAARGVAFHEWVASSHEQLALFPDWQDAVDAERAAPDELGDLIAGYRTTPYAAMVPHATETEVTATIGGLVVRGVIDAVFRHPDGTWEVVDWKTSREHTADPLQLAVYRIGWARRVGVRPEDVATAFVYVRDGEVVRPDLPDPAAVERMIAQRTGQTEKSAVTAQ
jgi:DNA helicase-2/ATP-dependent DNA helicase PcrA